MTKNIKIYYNEDFFSRYGVSISINQFNQYNDHSHNFYEFEYVIEGCAECFIDNKQYTAEPNDLIFVSPMNIHSYKKINGYVNTITIHFTDEILKNTFKLSELSGCIIKNVPQFKDIFYDALSEYNIFDDYSFYGISNILERIIIQFLRIHSKKNENKLHNIHLAEGYVSTHFRENITLESISKKFGYSQSYFCKLFKKTVGTGFNTYLNNCRLNYAYSLLTLSQMNITDICYTCGFNSLRNFTRAFRQKYGTTPSSMRKKQNLSCN